MVCLGVHLIVECSGCAPPLLDDAAALEALLARAAALIDARVVPAGFPRFVPQGVTGLLLLEESHLSIHTWPERGYAAVDLFSCGARDPEPAVRLIAQELGAGEVAVQRVLRGPAR